MKEVIDMAKTISPTDLVSAGVETYTIIDVRDSATFSQGAAEGALNIPLNPQTGKFGEEGFMSEDEAIEIITTLPHDKPIVVMCYHGIMSQYGATILEQFGYDAASVEQGYAGYLAAL